VTLVLMANGVRFSWRMACIAAPAAATLAAMLAATQAGAGLPRSVRP